jgi:hypothetical protein
MPISVPPEPSKLLGRSLLHPSQSGRPAKIAAKTQPARALRVEYAGTLGRFKFDMRIFVPSSVPRR